MRTPSINRKSLQVKETSCKGKHTGISRASSKFETMRREVKADVQIQNDLYLNN